MRHRVLACDFDGTLATEGVCSDQTVEALERVAAAGIRLVLVTGRTREELADVFDPGTLFEAIIVENGAVVIDVATGKEELLAPRIPSRLVAEFERTGVTPLVVGRVLFARPPGASSAKLSAAIAKVGADRQVVRNRDFGDGVAGRHQQAHRSRGSAARPRGIGLCHQSLSATARTTSRSSRSRGCRSLSRTRWTLSRPVPTWCSPNRMAGASSRLRTAIVAGDLEVLTALSPLAG